MVFISRFLSFKNSFFLSLFYRSDYLYEAHSRRDKKVLETEIPEIPSIPAIPV
jgi:hypothetical protein